jgi:pimeloyl-ACP methyl ester carboxylesterase
MKRSRLVKNRTRWSFHLNAGLLVALVSAGCATGDGRQRDHFQGSSTETAAMRTVASRDGTMIAYEVLGSGPPVILVNGALAGREAGAELAGLLARHATVYRYDRRGRGDSGDSRPHALVREVEDIAALVAQAGGVADLVGFSSGAALALEAASALGTKIRRLAIYEAPYDEAAGAADKWKTYRTEQADLLAAGRRSDAVVHHLRFVGMPDAALAEMRSSPAWEGMVAMAPALPYDAAALGDDRSVPVARLARIQAKVLVMDGGASRETMPFMRASAERIAQAIPDARRSTIAGQGHNVRAEAIAPVLIGFLTAE